MKVTLEEAEEDETKVAAEEGKRVAVSKGPPAVAGEGQDSDDNEGGKEDEDEGEHKDDDDDDEDGRSDNEGEEEEVKWARHYSSGQEILLVGEGDFSFSLSLAASFRSAANIVATSLDSYSQVTKKYRKAKSNLWRLKKRGATLLHGIDATQMKLHTDLKMRKFDKIIFNFPHAGFKGKEDDMRLINLHKQLVYGFFRNARHMIRRDGEVHISHKTSFPFCQWKLEELASMNSLVLMKCVDFKIEDYPGYNNKRGDGARCDQPFPLGECCTFMFRIGKPLRRKPPATNVVNLGDTIYSAALPERGPNCVPIASDGYLLLDTKRPPSFVPNHCGMLSSGGLPEGNLNCLPVASDGRLFLSTEGNSNRGPNLRVILPSAGVPGRNPDCVPITSDGNLLLCTERPPAAGHMRYINGWPNVEGFPGRSFLHGTRPQQLGHVTDLEGRTGSLSMDIGRLHGGCSQNASIRPEFISAVEDSLREGFEVYMNEAPGRTIHGYAAHLQELHRSSVAKMEWLRRMLLLRQAP